MGPRTRRMTFITELSGDNEFYVQNDFQGLFFLASFSSPEMPPPPFLEPTDHSKPFGVPRGQQQSEAGTPTHGRCEGACPWGWRLRGPGRCLRPCCCKCSGWSLLGVASPSALCQRLVPGLSASTELSRPCPWHRVHLLCLHRGNFHTAPRHASLQHGCPGTPGCPLASPHPTLTHVASASHLPALLSTLLGDPRLGLRCVGSRGSVTRSPAVVQRGETYWEMEPSLDNVPA